MKKAISIFLVVLLAVTAILAFSSCTTKSDPADNNGTTKVKDTPAAVKVGILKWVTHGALDEAEKGFIDALKAGGYIEGDNLTIDKQNANDNSTTAASIADKFINGNMDLILGIATPAVQSIQSKTETIPILGTAVTDYEKAKLVASNEKPGKNISGTSDLTPTKDQFEMLLKVLPDTKSVGIIYNSSEENSRIQAEEAKTIAESKGLKVEIKTFSSVNDIPQTAEALAKNVDAFWLPTDNTLASAMDVLIDKTMEKKIPVVCGEENMVKSGGTFTIGINYYNLGYQTGEMAVKILKEGTKPADMPIEWQKDMSIAINRKNADALGITFPADILDKATDVSK